MKRIVLSVTGSVLFVVGIILIPMPLPIGAIIAIAGLALLIHSNEFVRQTIRNWRQRYPDINEKVRRATVALPKPLQRVIRRTKPVINRHKKGASKRAFTNQSTPN
ncbi:hypothetical protein K0504_11040 [Neiella marina]|uniref:Transmembrane protein (PGPGW) n=1 Tax=Neiella holothuriorum TaxID=2870530 RepID=A0ABS7EI50_9GAMM|nr:PGPGW domain-containing protein [Neiella holothuriorum]MBW8191573.1 hypothetical protein [Neiella holothuriorum]